MCELLTQENKVDLKIKNSGFISDLTWDKWAIAVVILEEPWSILWPWTPVRVVRGFKSVICYTVHIEPDRLSGKRI